MSWVKVTVRSMHWTRHCEKRFFPIIQVCPDMHLVDYKVRVINSTEGTAARVRVIIESADEHDVWEHNRRE